MRNKTLLAAAFVLGSSMTASAGGLLDSNVSTPPAPPIVTAPPAQGSLGGSLPYILGGLLVVGALAGSGGGT